MTPNSCQNLFKGDCFFFFFLCDPVVYNLFEKSHGPWALQTTMRLIKLPNDSILSSIKQLPTLFNILNVDILLSLSFYIQNV